jgi:hypothetical protein
MLGVDASSVPVFKDSSASRSCCSKCREPPAAPAPGAGGVDASLAATEKPLSAPVEVTAPENAPHPPKRFAHRFNGLNYGYGCWGFDESSAAVNKLTGMAPLLVSYRRIRVKLEKI